MQTYISEDTTLFDEVMVAVLYDKISPIAADLFINKRTVDRHVSNILSTLNVSSRAAATAYAYEHDLIWIFMGNITHACTLQKLGILSDSLLSSPY